MFFYDKKTLIDKFSIIPYTFSRFVYDKEKQKDQKASLIVCKQKQKRGLF